MAAELPHPRPGSIALGHKLLAAGAVLIVVAAMATLAARMTVAKPIKQVGLCILVDDENRFLDAVIVVPSGDAEWDEATRVEMIGSRIDISHPPTNPWNEIWITDPTESAGKSAPAVDFECPPGIEAHHTR